MPGMKSEALTRDQQRELEKAVGVMLARVSEIFPSIQGEMAQGVGVIIQLPKRALSVRFVQQGGLVIPATQMPRFPANGGIPHG